MVFFTNWQDWFHCQWAPIAWPLETGRRFDRRWQSNSAADKFQNRTNRIPPVAAEYADLSAIASAKAEGIPAPVVRFLSTS